MIVPLHVTPASPLPSHILSVSAPVLVPLRNGVLEIGFGGCLVHCVYI